MSAIIFVIIIVVFLMFFLALSVLGFIAGIMNRITSWFTPKSRQTQRDTPIHKQPDKERVYTAEEGEYVEFEEIKE